MVRLDLGCGKAKREGFTGVDRIAFEGVDVVHDLSVYPWPWENDSVDEVYCAHMLEHIPARGRIRFVNELHRILKKGGKTTLIVPHWCSSRAYGDMTHEWPPVSEFWFYYLRRGWRVEEGNAPHDDAEFNPDGYSCDFDAGWGYALNPALAARNQEYQMYAMSWMKEACADIIATLTKR